MREIKFRAWSTKDKKMYHFDDKHLVVMGRQNRWSFGEPSWDWEMEEGTDETDGILMQYTGLKDANGKEIYEGDVVADQYGYRFEIVFRDGCWFAGNSEVGFSPKDTWNVIGNIYDNPELLN